MEKEYDFMSMGARYAKEGIISLSKMANEIGEKYGDDAKMEFEAGICLTIPIYSSIVELTKNEILGESSTQFGQNNKRNNSYFDRKGISNQYNITRNGKYNDPDVGRKSK